MKLKKLCFIVSTLFVALSAVSCRAQYQQPPAGTAPEKIVAPIIQPGDRSSAMSESTLPLAKDGKALQPIIIAADASDDIKATANYLAEKLEKITGAKFEIKSGDGASGIVVGTIKQFPVESLKKPLKIRRVLQSSEIKNGPEAYAIQTEAKRVLLLGGGEPGASHAVARFLELIGYRQFYPGAVWEVAPRQSTLSFNRNETDRPEILARHIWYAFGIPGDPYTAETMNWPAEKRLAGVNRSKEELDNWYRQNQWGESFHTATSHNYAPIIANHKAEFVAHPEYYILLDGKRSPRGICTSQPAVRALAAQDALAFFEKNPNADMYSMERGDGNITCQCDLCKAQGSESNRVFGLANEVAKAVAKKYPGKMIGVLSYNTHDLPPDFGLEPNVHVQIARLFITSKTPFLDLVEQWSRKTANFGIREYFSTYQHGQDRLRAKGTGGPTANLEILKSDIPYYAKHGALSMWSESSIAWGAHGRGNYVAAKLLWNPNVNVDALLQDFYDKAFGPAAPAMKQYFEQADEGKLDTEPTPAFYLALMDDLQEASTLAKARPDVLARIDQLKRYMIYNALQYRIKIEKDKKPVMLELLRHQFRTRYEYMTHWEANRKLMKPGPFVDASWVLPGWKVFYDAKKAGKPLPADPPWLDWNPYTHAETETKFDEAMKFLRNQPSAK